MCRKTILVICVSFLVTAAPLAPFAVAEIVYSEDFEGTGDGASLSTLPGWNIYEGAVNVSSASSIGTGLGIDGSTSIGGGSGIARSEGFIPAPSGAVSTWTFTADVYASAATANS